MLYPAKQHIIQAYIQLFLHTAASDGLTVMIDGSNSLIWAVAKGNECEGYLATATPANSLYHWQSVSTTIDRGVSLLDKYT